jgi:multidrug efflux pump
MTSLATVLGILPIALAIGAGSESRVSMGVAVIGGLVCGTLLTLFVVPAMYLLLQRRIGEGRVSSIQVGCPVLVPSESAEGGFAPNPEGAARL